MYEVVTLEGWSSPLVEAVTRTRFAAGGSMKMQGWDVVVFRNATRPPCCAPG
ncbi:hypothetical protein [Aminobacter sp. BE322]|uniref:hypothetical protein n=1 Tax=unclassified Aminobacter TaxID=2644704 RepID=UPI003D1C27B0